MGYFLGMMGVIGLHWAAWRLAGGNEVPPDRVVIRRRQLHIAECLLAVGVAVMIPAILRTRAGSEEEFGRLVLIATGIAALLGFVTAWAFYARRAMPRRTRRERLEYAVLCVLIVPGTLALICACVGAGEAFVDLVISLIASPG